MELLELPNVMPITVRSLGSRRAVAGPFSAIVAGETERERKSERGRSAGGSIVSLVCGGRGAGGVCAVCSLQFAASQVRSSNLRLAVVGWFPKISRKIWAVVTTRALSLGWNAPQREVLYMQVPARPYQRELATSTRMYSRRQSTRPATPPPARAAAGRGWPRTAPPAIVHCSG